MMKLDDTTAGTRTRTNSITMDLQLKVRIPAAVSPTAR